MTQDTWHILYILVLLGAAHIIHNIHDAGILCGTITQGFLKVAEETVFLWHLFLGFKCIITCLLRVCYTYTPGMPFRGEMKGPLGFLIYNQKLLIFVAGVAYTCMYIRSLTLRLLFIQLATEKTKKKKQLNPRLAMAKSKKKTIIHIIWVLYHHQPHACEHITYPINSKR